MEQLRVGDESYGFHRLDAAAARLPYTLRILLENALRNGSEEEADAVSGWVADADPSREISFHPARVLLQDFTGVPAVVDLAAMRNAMRDVQEGRDPQNVIRDPAKNRALETSCWNTVMTVEQFEAKGKPAIPPGAARRTVSESVAP